MNPLTCMIVDDEQVSIDIVADYVKQTPSLKLLYTATNPLQALDWLASNEVDLCFADIEMPQLNGMEFIRVAAGKCRFIMCTAHVHYAIQGFENNVIDFLQKPVEYPRFLQAVQKALPIFHNRQPAAQGTDWIFVQTGQKNTYIKLLYSEIIYVQSSGNYLYFITATQKILSYVLLKDAEKQLPAKLFIRVHKSFIISINHIVRLEGNVLILRHANETITVGRSYREAVLAALNIADE
jgi:two-component system, LytTR family, response regulator